MTEDPLKAIVYSLHDSLMVLAPGGWAQVELEVVPTRAGLKLAALSTRGEGAKAPRPSPELGISREHEAARLGEGLDELAHRLSHAGKTWLGGKARVRKGPDHADFELLDGEKSVWLTRVSRAELDELLITDALLDAVLGTQAAFAGLQESLKVDEGAKLVELGTYEPDEFVFRWNHEHADVRRICGVESKPTGLSAFYRAGLACDEGFAWALCSHVVVAMGARGAYRMPGELVRFSAVMR
ncbi:MAG: hypothetical protein IPJ65_36520 [Archangiaceae bacterium]|nr:hypothetical protein [Archangiaceae bacterium]